MSKKNERTCIYCGCMDSHACPGGCFWVEKHEHTPTGVCSRCIKDLIIVEVARLKLKPGDLVVLRLSEGLCTKAIIHCAICWLRKILPKRKILVCADAVNFGGMDAAQFAPLFTAEQIGQMAAAKEQLTGGPLQKTRSVPLAGRVERKEN